MSVSPRRRGIRRTRGLQAAGLLVTSAPAGNPLQCRSESAGGAAAPAQGRLALHNLPEGEDMFSMSKAERKCVLKTKSLGAEELIQWLT